MNATFTPVSAVIGGVTIGVAAGLMWLGAGRIAGITGILAGALRVRAGDLGWRLSFLAGLIGGAVFLQRLWPTAFADQLRRPTLVVVVAGLLVGFGTRMGNGCTSGHGVCGIGRLSKRSLVATVVFCAAGMVTVLVSRKLGMAGP